MTYSTRQFIIRQRYLMIQDHKEHFKIVAIARKYRTSRQTVYRWIRRFDLEGKSGLLDQSHRPHSVHPKALKASTVEAIISFRKKTNYGPKRIRFYLAKRNISVSEYAIYKTLMRHELIRRYRTKKKCSLKAYYSPYPGAVVQTDTKHLDTTPGHPHRLYQYTATDCFTRMRVIRIYDELSAQNSVRFLEEVRRRWPFKIQTLRTDNGVEFTYGAFKKDHPFHLACLGAGINHRLNRPAHPEANGRVERSHRTDDEEFYSVNPVKNPKAWKYRIQAWENFYNYHRPHQSLNNLSPWQFYKRYIKEQEAKSVT